MPEHPRVKVTPMLATLSEAVEVDGLTVVLELAPDGDVALDVTSSDVTEALVSTASTVPSAAIVMTFTPEDWQVEQVVTVTGVDDAYPDGAQLLVVAIEINQTLTTDTTGYADLVATDIDRTLFVVADDDIGRVLVTPGITTFPEAGAGGFSIALSSQPKGVVFLMCTSLDTSEALLAFPGQFPPSEQLLVSFDAGTWSTTQDIVIAGVDDATVDGDQSVTIDISVDAMTEATTGYLSLDPALIDDVTVTVLDDD